MAREYIIEKILVACCVSAWWINNYRIHRHVYRLGKNIFRVNNFEKQLLDERVKGKLFVVLSPPEFYMYSLENAVI